MNRLILLLRDILTSTPMSRTQVWRHLNRTHRRTD